MNHAGKPWAARLSWPSRVALAVLAGVLAWAGLRVAGIPQDTLTVDIGSDRPIAGSISYQGTFPVSGTYKKTIAPEQVTQAVTEQQDITVTVTPLGKLNPRAPGTVVWLYEVSSTYESVGATRLAQMRLPESWVASNSALLNLGTPEPLEISMKAGSYIDVKLLRFEWGGGVRIAVGDVSRTVDLYSDGAESPAFRLLLPVPLETPQRISTSLRNDARSLTITFSGGPRVVRIERAQRVGSSQWSWDPSNASEMKLGPGVGLLRTDADGVLLNIEGETGSVSFPSIRARRYWLPESGDFALMAVVGLLSLGALAALDGGTRIGRAVRAYSPGQIVFAIAALVMTVLVAVWIVNPQETGMWKYIYLPRGALIGAGEVYTFTYPVWGYPMLAAAALAASPDHAARLLVVSQVVLAFALLVSLYLPVLRGTSWWMGALLGLMTLPVLTAAGQPLADAVYLLGVLLLLACLRVSLGADLSEKQRFACLLLAALSWGIAANMRSEAQLSAFVLSALFAGACMFRYPSAETRSLVRRAALFWTVALCGAVIGLTPWWLHTRAVNGHGLWSATNSGLVMWIGLGQLPDNPWGRVPLDSVGSAVASANGWGYICSMRADKEFRALFVADVKCYPRAFAEKFALNSARALWEGPNLSPLRTEGARFEARAARALSQLEPVLRSVYHGVVIGLGALIVALVTMPRFRRDMGARTVLLLLSTLGFAAFSIAIIGIGLWVPRLGGPILAVLVYAFSVASLRPRELT